MRRNFFSANTTVNLRLEQGEKLFLICRDIGNRDLAHFRQKAVIVRVNSWFNFHPVIKGQLLVFRGETRSGEGYH